MMAQTENRHNNNNNFRQTSLTFLFYLALTSFTMFLVYNLWMRFVSNPTVTSLESSSYPVASVPFPGIAFCNLNKISRKRAIELANYIVNNTGEDYDTTLESIRFLGNLYDSNYDPHARVKMEHFQNILDQLKITITEVTRRLMTPCEELLKRCEWKSVQVNCSKIFFTRLTFDGFCCAFNYVKNTSEWTLTTGMAEEHQESMGVRNGLTVLLFNNPEDYFHTVLSSTGVQVHVFLPLDYPDKTSGNLIESITDIGSENFLEIVPTTVTAVRDVKDYPLEKRQCLFAQEKITQFGTYSQSDCNVDCRIQAMKTLCECVPFYIPMPEEEITCTLRDVQCLNKFRRKFFSLTPEGISNGVSFTEEQDGLYCHEKCFPPCEETLYAVSPSAVPLFNPAYRRNHTVVHAYYRSRFHSLYKQDVVYYWFEILSNFGGTFGLVMGISLISVIEVVIFSVKFLVRKYKD